MNVRAFLLVLSALGVLLFGGILTLAVYSPVSIEKASREILRAEIERRTGAKVDQLSGSVLGRLASKAAQKANADIAATREAIRAEIPQRVATVIADMLRVDCECRQRLLDNTRRAYERKLGSLVEVRDRLNALIESAYADVRDHLLREVIIFSGSNAAAFLALGLIVLARPAAGMQLALVALVVVGAVALTGAVYLLGQNWLYTILFNDYVGLGYAAYLSAVALLLADIVFNRARVTTRMVNTMFQAFGSALQAVPC